MLAVNFDLVINLDKDREACAIADRVDRRATMRNVQLLRVAVLGGINSAITLGRGSRDEIRRAVFQAVEILGPGGGFILSTGDQCGRETPDDNLFALVETAKTHGVYDANGQVELRR